MNDTKMGYVWDLEITTAKTRGWTKGGDRCRHGEKMDARYRCQ